MKVRWFTALLVALIPLSLLGTYLSVTSPYIGYYCYQNEAGPHCPLYKAEYQALPGFKTIGIYHSMKTSTEKVFYLETDNGTLLRLIFYCKNGMLVTTHDVGNGTFGGYSYCENVSFKDGARIMIEGTLVTPSAWNPALSTPSITFAGDLYAFEISTG